jgi:hypothetical protein
MRSNVWRSAVRTAAVALGILVLGGTAAAAKPAPVPSRPRAMNLFASANLLYGVNRVLCNLVSSGEVCSAGNSPVGGGGFWPNGTPDQYIFNSGLQLAGVIPTTAGFTWAGDTVGAFFFDARGDQGSGDPLGGLYYSLDPADAAAWPNGAVARDTALYHPVLLGRNQVSQGDVWVRYWDGNPALLGGRTHPMGILVDQRAMAWNYPTGNESILYFVFTFYNVTARTAAVYDNPTIDPAIRNEIAAFGAEFQDLNEQRFAVQIPDGGYSMTDLFAAFAMDADVAVFRDNYSTAVLPFNLGMVYSGTFLPEVGWQFPSDLFGTPFFPGSGFVGVKYLRSPTNQTGQQIGLTMFSNTTNSTAFPDPQGVKQLYRYLSGFLGPTDPPCSPFSNPVTARQRRLCFLAQSKDDARFYQSSGPFVLPPGESRTIVVAYLMAAPTDVVTPFVGGDLKPQIPFTGDSIAADPSKVRTIERIAGWVSQADNSPADGIITEREVTTTPRSLLNKARVAQTVYDNRFLLPFAPDAPQFYLVPGDNQVTVVWQPSQSETTGDPFYAVASQPLTPQGGPNPLFDRNFRQFDVEGYRIYRGRTAAEMQLVAQFDYSGTVIRDFTGAINYPDEDGDGQLECAPELGLTDDCPPFPNEVELFGEIIQVPAGGRVQLAGGGVLVLQADTAVTGGGSGFPGLGNTGVPFAYVDQSVRNSFQYVYAVTAFDVNSLTSGPSSLESPRVIKRVTPRKGVQNQEQPDIAATVIQGDSGIVLTPGAAWTVDANTGRFPGPPPPAGGLEVLFNPLVPQLLGPLASPLTVRIDSVLPRTDQDFLCPESNIQGICFEFFVSYIVGTDTSHVRQPVFWPIWDGFGEPTSADNQLGGKLVRADSVTSARFGIPNGGASLNATLQVTLGQYINYSAEEGQGGRRLGGSISPGGSRWFSGANETVDHPAYSVRVGVLTGVDTIFSPISHVDPDPNTAGVQARTPAFSAGAVATVMQCHAYAVSALGRQADIRVTWGAGGTIASVRDVTHHVALQFHAIPQAGYGFITDQNGNGMVDWRDFDFMAGVSQSNDHLGFCQPTHATGSPPPQGLLVAQPAIGPISTNGAATGGTDAGFASTGTGFGLYINGQVFILQLTGGTPPAAGTVWTLRSYAGFVGAATNAGTTAPSGYTFTPGTPSLAVPGLRAIFSGAAGRPELTTETAADLSSVHTVPDPYYVANALELTANNKILRFVNLPARALIRIYSVSGVLVAVIPHDDPGFGGEETWNLRNRNNQLVASGVYFYHVETPAGNQKVGRFTVVTFAP